MTSEKEDYPGNSGNPSGHGDAGEGQNGEEARAEFHLRLFVTGSTSRSQQAIQNIRQICEEHLQGRYELEIIDISQDPNQAREHQILAVPTLLKELAPQLRKIWGDLSERGKVLEDLTVQFKTGQ